MIGAAPERDSGRVHTCFLSYHCFKHLYSLSLNSNNLSRAEKINKRKREKNRNIFFKYH